MNEKIKCWMFSSPFVSIILTCYEDILWGKSQGESMVYKKLTGPQCLWFSFQLAMTSTSSISILPFSSILSGQARPTWYRKFWKFELKLSSFLKLFLPMYFSHSLKIICQWKCFPKDRANYLKSTILFAELFVSILLSVSASLQRKNFP